jgi:perosamine synthetase
MVDSQSSRADITKDEPIAFARPWLGPEEETAVAEVVRSGWIVGGPKLEELERRFAELCGARHAIGVSSWTTGAFLVLHAWGIRPGDEVVVPSLTFIATVNVIRHVGATPVFADIDAQTFNVDPEDVARKIGKNTRVLMPVDQLGLPCDIDAVAALADRFGLRVLDDAACAFGSSNRGRPVGSLADATVFSLHARKVVTTGEGGMIVTDDDVFAERLRRLRHQGMSLSDHARHAMRPTVFETYPEIGYNHRITDLQAAIGLPQLDRLREILERRRDVACRYNEALANHPLLILPYVPEGMTPNWQSYQVSLRDSSVARRNEIMDRLHDRGVPTRRGVMASHLEAPYLDQRTSLPVTEAVAASTFQLPMHPGLTTEQLDRITAELQRL